MEKTFQKIQSENDGLKIEMEKVLKGNKAAGKRARKHLKEIMDLSKQLRKEIQEAKNAA